MNIFYSDENPVIAAQNLDSKRVIKQVLEACQLLSNSMFIRGLDSPYLPTHEHHPVSLAINYETANYKWLLEHFEALLKEYTFRYGKTHKCQEHLETFKNNPPDGTNSQYLMITLPNCTPFKNEKDLVKAYRMCLLDKWANDKRKPTWKGPMNDRKPPEWAVNSAWFTLYSKYEINNNE